MSLETLGPYLSAFAAAGTVGVLGFLLNFVRTFRDAYSEQLRALEAQSAAAARQREVTEERLKLAEENLQRTKDWHATEAAALKGRIEELLSGSPSSVGAIVASGGSIQLPSELRDTLTTILNTVREARQAAGPEPSRDPDYFLEIAKGFAATDQWLDAAEYYQEYLRFKPRDWEVHFLRAVALSNSRQGHDTNLEALLSLNSAIALVPWDIDRNLHARLYAYRGADLKRLGRLEEAESDLLLARRWATADYEISDITYNLACVHALAGRRAEMFVELKALLSDSRWKTALQAKTAYFKHFLKDPEFRELIGLPSQHTQHAEKMSKSLTPRSDA